MLLGDSQKFEYSLSDDKKYFKRENEIQMMQKHFRCSGQIHTGVASRTTSLFLCVKSRLISFEMSHITAAFLMQWNMKHPISGCRYSHPFHRALVLLVVIYWNCRLSKVLSLNIRFLECNWVIKTLNPRDREYKSL